MEKLINLYAGVLAMIVASLVLEGFSLLANPHAKRAKGRATIKSGCLRRPRNQTRQDKEKLKCAA